MSRLRRDRYQRRLTRLLEIADDEAFFLMIWATRAIQSHRQGVVGRLLNYPTKAATPDLTSPYAVHPWKQETLLNECLVTRKISRGPGKAILNCREFSAMAAVSNALHELENACDGIILEKGNVFLEMNRIAQRQFEWQRGFINYPQFYRAAYIFGGPLVDQFVRSAYGFSVPEFMQAGFLLRALFNRHPVVARDLPTEQIGLPKNRFNSILQVISKPAIEARQLAAHLRSGPGHVSYKKSIFRQYPCIAFGQESQRFITPLPDLITLRTSSGIFYEVANGPPPAKKEMADRFETYCRELFESWLPSVEILPPKKYYLRKDDIETPDIRILVGGSISVVVECKARRMSYLARFGENPFVDDGGAYGEIAKGVFQIWRHISHMRQGLVPGEKASVPVAGIVLTLDSWLTMADPLRAQVVAKANDLADKYGNILPEDRIGVLFCPVDDLERTLAAAPGDNFFRVLSAARSEEYKNWMLSSISERVIPKEESQNHYPFENRMGDVLPWWSMFSEQ